MTIYTRTLSTIAAAAVAVTIAVAAAAAAQAGTPGPRQGPGRGGPGHFPVLRQLNLTDAQRQQIKALVDEQRAAGTGQSPRRTLGELQRSLTAALFADTPDTARIDELKASIAEAEAAALTSRVDLQLKIAQILTPEQRKQARESDGRGPRLGRAIGPRGLDFPGNR